MTGIEAGAPPKRPRFVDSAPYHPDDDPTDGARPELDAPAWRLALRRLMRHRLAAASGVFLLTLYLMLPFMGFFAPYGPNEKDIEHLQMPPQSIYWFDEGGFVGPYVVKTDAKADLATMRWTYHEDHSVKLPIKFFCEGAEYRILGGLFTSKLHLFCAPEGGSVHLLGTDKVGKDVFSRILYGAQLSMIVGLLGIFISFAIGVTLGGLAGYFGGLLDAAVMRLIEVLRSLPELPLYLALAAAVPPNWSSLSVFLMITVILGVLDWPGVARAVRSKFLALREEDFVSAAELMGASPGRVVRRHLLPNFASHLVASAALSIPAMILGETALSFLGLGLRYPDVSWGVMLNDALSLSAITLQPWLLTAVAPVVLVVLAFNFLGDGLRDALDPYSER
ncbi:MAG: ABC transporter permease [Neomegalonema sp.]|nr:ABC transporter permease [Neomegalonema sp.]